MMIVTMMMMRMVTMMMMITFCCCMPSISPNSTGWAVPNTRNPKSKSNNWKSKYVKVKVCMLSITNQQHWLASTSTMGWSLTFSTMPSEIFTTFNLRYLPYSKIFPSWDIPYLRYQSSCISPILEIGHMRYLLFEISVMRQKLRLSEILFKGEQHFPQYKKLSSIRNKAIKTFIFFAIQ